MRSTIGLFALLASAPSTGLAFEVGAHGTPSSVVDRGLTLKQGQLRADFAPRDFALMFGGIGGRSLTQDVPGLRAGRVDNRAPLLEDATRLTLTVGAGYGITDDIEVGALLLPIYIAPDADFGDIELYGRYRLLTGDVEVGVQATLQIPTGTDFAFSAGVPIAFHLGSLRVDTGAQMEVVIRDPSNEVDLDIPAAFTVDIGDGVFGGARTGLYAQDLDHVAVPLMGFIGYTLVGAGAPVADLVATFGWPRFLWTGPGDTADLDTFDLILGARFFFTVM